MVGYIAELAFRGIGGPKNKRGHSSRKGGASFLFRFLGTVNRVVPNKYINAKSKNVYIWLALLACIKSFVVTDIKGVIEIIFFLYTT